MKRWGLVALMMVVAVGGTAFAVAQSTRTANVEIRVWEDVNDPARNYISARPEGGSWRTLGTIPIPLTDGQSGRFRYGDITLGVPLPDASEATATPTPRPAPTRTPAPTPSATRPVIHHDDGDWIYESSYGSRLRWIGWHLEDGSVGTTVQIQSDSVDPSTLRVQCMEGELDIYLWPNDHILVRNDEMFGGRVTLKIGRNSIRTQNWENVTGYDSLDPVLRASDPVGLLSEMKGQLQILIYGGRYGSTVRVISFDLGRLLQTPVQWNIDHCGEY